MAKAPKASMLKRFIDANSDASVQKLWTNYADKMKPKQKHIGTVTRHQTRKAAKTLGKEIGQLKAEGATDEALKNYKKLHRAYLDKVDMLDGVESYKDMYSQMTSFYQLQRGEDKAKSLGDHLKAGIDVGLDYFVLSANKKQKAARIGTAAVGTFVGANATRYMTGGTFGYNSRGERDIAGIPFI